MSLLDELLATLSDAPLETVCVGAHWTAVVVLKDGRPRCGLASTLPGEGPHGESPVRWAGRLLERRALELAGLLRSEQTLEASIGLAAVNALLEVDESRCREENALDILEREGRGKRVALVGHFPFIPRLRPAVGELWVLEERPAPDEFPAERASELLPRADVVAITGAALVNHTLEALLALCRPEAFVLVLGPSTPLSPVLFRYGATALAGVRVVDPAAVLRCVSQGATFRQIEGVRTVVMARSSLWR